MFWNGWICEKLKKSIVKIVHIPKKEEVSKNGLQISKCCNIISEYLEGDILRDALKYIRAASSFGRAPDS